MPSGVMTTVGKNLLRDAMKGGNAQVRYMAVGTSTTAPSASDTQLGAEAFRKAVTTYANGTNPGEIVVSMYIGPGEIVGTTIEEVGIFAGNGASSATNSGVLLARGLFHHANKSNIESVIVQLDLALS